MKLKRRLSSVVVLKVFGACGFIVTCPVTVAVWRTPRDRGAKPVG